MPGAARSESTTDAQPPRKPLVAGWREHVDLPGWGIRRLRAKLDTGARSCAIDVLHWEELDDERVGFELVISRAKGRSVTVEAPISRRAVVTPTTGRGAPRVFVSTELVLGPFRREVEIGLVCRRAMRYRMLIGRAALGSAVLVDPGRTERLTARRRRPRSAS